jgi:hypothetical protein
MADEDHYAAVGRMAVRYSDLKRRWTQLAAEAAEVGCILQEAGQFLREMDAIAERDDRTRSGLSWDNLVPLLPTHAAERANALIVELRDVSREIRATRERLKNAGVQFES